MVLLTSGSHPKYADMPQPDFDNLAEGFGTKGCHRVNKPDDLGEIDKVRINGEVELPVSWEIVQYLS